MSDDRQEGIEPRKKFWVVCLHDGRNRYYDTYDSAFKEASRVARNNVNKEVYLLEPRAVIGTQVTVTIQTIED